MIPFHSGPVAAPDPFALLAGELRALRQDFARMLRPSGGGNPFGYSPRPATIYEYGVGHSGPRQVIDDTGSKQLLNIALKEIVPQGYYGMATIHVSVKTERLIPADERADLPPNGFLVGHLKWQNGDAGGDEDVDLTRGAIIPVGATTSIQLEAEFVSAVEGEELVLFRTVSAEAGVSWETSSDKDPAMTLPGVALVEDVASAWFEIPLQARSMLGLGTPSTAFPTLIAQFSISDGAGARVLYEVPDPFRNGAPIRNGVNFVRFLNSVPMTFIQSTFDLW